MGQFTESLTIQILGDSRGLQQELENAARAVEEFQGQLAQLSQWSQQLGTVMDRLGNTRSLSAVNGILSQIRRQMQAINETPLIINVAPAMANLAMLSSALDFILAKIMAVRSMGVISSFSGGGGGGVTPGPVREFASGGPVTGEPGIDRVPALLTAGEFVVSSPAVRELGQGFLWALNESPMKLMEETQSRSLRRGAESVVGPSGGGSGGRIRDSLTGMGTTSNHITHVGGVTIHMHPGIDGESALRSLKMEEISLRNRRG